MTTTVKRIPGRLEQLAIDRHQRDLANPPNGCYYDQSAADRVVEFMRRYCSHTKGRWAGQPFEPSPWQIESIINPLFGWKRADGRRRFRVGFVEVARKNGKSSIAAAIGLYMLVADGEQGAEVYVGATRLQQARIVWDQARDMVLQSPVLQKHVEVFGGHSPNSPAMSLVCHELMASFKPESRDAQRLDGLNIHCAILDELHAHATPEMWDVVVTATGAREQPLVLAVTTAGVYSPESIGWRQHKHAASILDGSIQDDSYFAFIASADEGDDWQDPTTWAKANPGIGYTIEEEYLAEQCARAQSEPSFQNTFRIKHNNEWLQQAERWLDMGVWEKCDAEPPHDLRGRACYGGLDLASTRDLTALALVFPDGDYYDVVMRFWLPADNMAKRVHDDRVPYDAWVRDGYISTTEGNVFDDRAVLAEVVRLGAMYDIKEIAYDRMLAGAIVNSLTGEGFEVVPVGQGWYGMNAPAKELEKIVYSGRLRHGGNPVLRWMASNVTIERDPADNIKLSKKESREKIDGMVALAMAVGRAVAHQDEGVWTWGAV